MTGALPFNQPTNAKQQDHANRQEAGDTSFDCTERPDVHCVTALFVKTCSKLYFVTNETNERKAKKRKKKKKKEKKRKEYETIHRLSFFPNFFDDKDRRYGNMKMKLDIKIIRFFDFENSIRHRKPICVKTMPGLVLDAALNQHLCRPQLRFFQCSSKLK